MKKKKWGVHSESRISWSGEEAVGKTRKDFGQMLQFLFLAGGVNSKSTAGIACC